MDGASIRRSRRVDPLAVEPDAADARVINGDRAVLEIERMINAHVGRRCAGEHGRVEAVR